MQYITDIFVDTAYKQSHVKNIFENKCKMYVMHSIIVCKIYFLFSMDTCSRSDKDTIIWLHITLYRGSYHEYFNGPSLDNNEKLCWLSEDNISPCAADCHWSEFILAASSPADGSRSLTLQGLRAQRYWVWLADWHEHDMSSAPQSPTLRAEAITASSEVQ